MKRKIYCLVAAAILLLSLLGCQPSNTADTPAESDTTSSQPTAAPTTQPPTEETTDPLPQFIEVWREGQVSQIPVELIRGSVGNYTVAIDPEYFTFLPQEGYDLFSYEAWGSEHPVYFTVTPYPGAYDPEQFAQECLLTHSDAYEFAQSQETAVGSYNATLVTLDGSKDTPGYCRHFYLLSCGETCYAIEAEFTMEMYEGLYAIMRAMFDTFTAQTA